MHNQPIFVMASYFPESLSSSLEELIDTPLLSSTLVSATQHFATRQPRIEVRLFNKQTAAERQLVKLRKAHEAQEQAALQTKPQISRRSRLLAVKAEQRFFQQLKAGDSKSRKTSAEPSPTVARRASTRPKLRRCVLELTEESLIASGKPAVYSRQATTEGSSTVTPSSCSSAGLSPFQVPVAFEAGCNLHRLLTKLQL